MPETKQYGIIYADPPWRYDRKHGSGVAENHYPTMSIEEICARIGACRKRQRPFSVGNLPTAQ